MIINHNVSALNAWRQLGVTNHGLSKTLERLSSGLRINRAADDAAGLAISEKMRAQISGLTMARKNAQDSVSLIQTAEGALHEADSIIQRVRELAVQSASDTMTDEDRGKLQNEVDQLISELDRIAKTTDFNTLKLLDGSKSSGEFVAGEATLVAEKGTGNIAITSTAVSINADETYSVRVVQNSTSAASVDIVVYNAAGTAVTTVAGQDPAVTLAIGVDTAAITINLAANYAVGDEAVVVARQEIAATADQSLTMHIGANSLQNTKVNMADMSAAALHVDGLKIDTALKANAAVASVDWALEKLNTQRSELGAFQNRLEHTINNLGVASENLTAAESRIRDADMAAEMVNFTRNQILMQSGTAMLAQANIAPQSVLQLLR